VLLLALLPTVLLRTLSAGAPGNQLTTQASVWTNNSRISPLFVDTSCGVLLQTFGPCCCPSLASLNNPITYFSACLPCSDPCFFKRLEAPEAGTFHPQQLQ
jgi:hypothetical protein